MKLISYPPLIIFLDLLFVFLFLFILNTDKVVEVSLPEGRLIDGAKIVLYDKNLQDYFSLDNKRYVEKESSYTYLEECNALIIECQKAMKINKNAFIIYPKKLQKEISDIVFLSLGTGSCKKLNLLVKENGELDYKENLSLNKCLKNLHGFEDFVRNNKKT